MKWIVFLCFVFISFTALAEGTYENKPAAKKKLNFRSLASVNNAQVESEIIQARDQNLLDEEQRKYLYEKENWEKTLDFMEKNSWSEQR